MFGSKWRKKYNILLSRYARLAADYEQLQKQWNDLVRRVNAKGGEEFLEKGALHQASGDLSPEEIRMLINLCHPDKHGGKDAAKRMTTKLLELRR